MTRSSIRAVATALASWVVVGCGEVPEPEAAPDVPAAAQSEAPAGPDVFMADLSTRDGFPSLGPLVNLTDRPGYDNQPHFTPDGAAVWVTVQGPESADIWRFDLATMTGVNVTASDPESEYSATPLPDRPGFSSIRVEADSTQRLWRFDPGGMEEEVLLQDVAPVGYHAWADEQTVVMFVLGDPPTLQVADVTTGEVRTLDQRIGRSLQKVPGGARVSYVRVRDEGSVIMELDPAAGTATELTAVVPGRQDHAWTPDGILLMGDSTSLLAKRPGSDDDWRQVADLSDWGSDVTRLAVSPDGRRIAIVMEPSGL